MNAEIISLSERSTQHATSMWHQLVDGHSHMDANCKRNIQKKIKHCHRIIYHSQTNTIQITTIPHSTNVNKLSYVRNGISDSANFYGTVRTVK